MSPEEKAALEAENASLKQQLATAEAAQKAAAAAKLHADHVSYAEGLLTQGKLAQSTRMPLLPSWTSRKRIPRWSLARAMPRQRCQQLSRGSWPICRR